MKKGGYKIIDFKGTALSGTAVEIPGIYDKIVNNYKKAILVSGVVLNGELQDDAFATVKVNEGSVDLTVYGGVITVTEDDEVTFVLAKTSAELTAEIGDLDELETTDKLSLVGAINEVNLKSVRYRTITATTNINGVAILAMPVSNYNVISAVIISVDGTKTALLTRSGTDHYVYVKNGATMDAIANTDVAIGIYYTDV